jgi:hypothetical protein
MPAYTSGRRILAAPAAYLIAPASISLAIMFFIA